MNVPVRAGPGRPLISGLEYRLFAWVVFNIVGIAFVLSYVSKIRKDTKRSIMHKEDSYWRQREASDVNNITYYKPRMAWQVYAAVLLAHTTLILFGFLLLIPTVTMDLSGF